MTQFDYANQAWLIDGFYVACGHVACKNCYGAIHEGEPGDPGLVHLYTFTRELYCFTLELSGRRERQP